MMPANPLQPKHRMSRRKQLVATLLGLVSRTGTPTTFRSNAIVVFVLLVIGVMSWTIYSKRSKKARATQAYWVKLELIMTELDKNTERDPSLPEDLTSALTVAEEQAGIARDKITALEVTDVDQELVDFGSRLIEWLDRNRLNARDSRWFHESAMQLQEDAGSLWGSFNDFVFNLKEHFILGLTKGQTGKPANSSFKSSIDKREESLRKELEVILAVIRDIENDEIELRHDANQLRGELSLRYALEFPPLYYDGTTVN
jgi:hypothetical protein